MSAIVEFGETVDGYAVPVLNERAVRAGAGLLFFLAAAVAAVVLATGNTWAAQPTVWIVNCLTMRYP